MAKLFLQYQTLLLKQTYGTDIYERGFEENEQMNLLQVIWSSFDWFCM